jgi:ATP/maltotriose-dependent transcriptional regulator MalT
MLGYARFGLAMTAVADQLVGRSAELGAIDQALADLERRSFAALEVRGEPGIGKTRLLAELGERADEAGHIVLSGSATELEGEVPFWVLLDALDEYLQSLEPRRLRSLEDDTLADLAQVFPSIPRPENGGSAPGDARFRIHRAVRLLLEALSATKPLVLILDDLHWADPASVEALGSLLRRPPGAQVLVGMAMRPRQVPEALAGTLEQAHSAGTVTRLELGALSPGEARELLGTDLPDAAADALYADSWGNPFYLQQLARSPDGAGHGTPGAAGVSLAGVEVPQAVATALTAELATLGDGDRRVLEGAAVAGDPFEPELAAAAAGVDETTAITALDELLRRDLVRQTEVPRRFRFRHPLVRGAVYEAAPGGWLLAAHERTSAALALRGSTATARAHHVERSARVGDMEGVAVLRDAGREALSRAPVSAGRLFAAALRLMPSTAPIAERVELLESLAGAHATAGHFRDAYDAMRESLELRADEPLPNRLSSIAALAFIENLLGRHGEAHDRLMAALEEVPDRTSEEGVAVMIEISIDAFFRTDYATMRQFAHDAREAARGLGDRVLMSTPAGVLAFADTLDGAVKDSQASIAEAAALVDSLSDDELVRARRGVNNLASAEVYSERYADAERHAERSLAVALATGQAQFIPVLFWTGMVRAARGRLAEAAELHETAAEIARVTGHAQGLAWNLCGRSITATAAGDIEKALSAAEDAVAAVAGEAESFPVKWARVGHAVALAEAGEFARAREVLLAAAGGEELQHMPAGWRPALYEVLARSALECGDAEQADRAVARAEAMASAMAPLKLPRAWADRTAASMALRRGDAKGAADRALAAADAMAEVGAVIEEARARVIAGRALAEAGDRDRAVEELEAAARIFDACGAVARRDAADRDLGKLGRRVHRRTRRGKADGTGLELLTDRELEVARLVVDRKTNAQIAAELFLSPKTVETHIRHLFQKLEVSSRVEVARAVERAERDAHAK